MRDEDRARILHMIEAADAMAQFVAGRSREDLDHNRMLLFALVHAIGVFGEAASRVSPDTRAAAPQIPWSAIVSMRNRLIHGYLRYRHDGGVEDCNHGSSGTNDPLADHGRS